MTVSIGQRSTVRVRRIPAVYVGEWGKAHT